MAHLTATTNGSEQLTLAGHTHKVNRLAVSPYGNSIVSASGYGTLEMRDIASGSQRYTLAGYTHVVSWVAISPGGLWIVSASGDKSLKVWDADSWHMWSLSAPRKLYACAFFADGERIVAGGARGVYWLRLVR